MRKTWLKVLGVACVVLLATIVTASPPPYAIGDLFVATGPTSTGRIAAGAAGTVLTSNGAATLPSYETPVAGGQAFPVGSIYISVTSTNPATTLGYGTWIAFGTGRVLVGLDSGDTDFDTEEETGGAKTVASAGTNSAPVFTGVALGTHTHTVGTYANSSDSAGTPAGTNSAPTFTGSALSTHSHGVGTYDNAAASAGTPAGTIAWPAGVPTHSGTTATFTGNAVAAASTNATPDLVTSNTTGTGVSPVTTATGTVNITSQGTIAWPAGVPTFTGSSLANHDHTLSGSSEAVSAGTPAGTVSAPTFTGSALGTHTHTIAGSSGAVSAGTPAGAVSAPTFTGSATSVVQSFIVVRFWKRTA